MTDHPYDVYVEDDTGNVGWECRNCNHDSGANFATVIAAEEDAERFHNEAVETDPRVLTDQEQANQLAEYAYEQDGSG
jgi:hypothetical protein